MTNYDIFALPLTYIFFAIYAGRKQRMLGLKLLMLLKKIGTSFLSSLAEKILVFPKIPKNTLVL